MSIHRDNCVGDAKSPEVIDDACAEAFATVTAVIERGDTLTDEQLDWVKRHGGLPERPDTDAVARWLRKRQR